MNSTDAALAWLLSLSATCSSSPFRPSSPSSSQDNSFTDWLPASSSPLQDVSSSSRVNSAGDIFLHHGLPDISLIDNNSSSLMMHSSSTTLVNSPSPRSLAFLDSPTFRDDRHLAPLNPSMFHSPASKLINELTNSPFASFYDPSAGALPLLSFSDVSPVVRASHKAEEPLLEKEKENIKKRKKKSKLRTTRTLSSSFLEKLESASTTTTLQQRPPSPRALPLPTHLPSDLNLLPGSRPVLLSPVKLPTLPHVAQDISDHPELCIIPAPVFSTPPRPVNDPLSPLSPLTPLSSPTDPEPSRPASLKLKLVLKRKNSDPPSTPIKGIKRLRTRSVALDPSAPIEQPHTAAAPTSENETELSEDDVPRPVYSKRTLPTDVEISSAFPLLYRRFPASMYYQPPDADSPCTLFHLAHPGGNYNPPRRVFDLYTPRFVKGKGVEKVGLCPICVEPLTRGGDSKRLWLAMKYSAFKCYHMQYAHGISASTGKPFSPPTAFRIVPRQDAGKNEKHHIQQGKCHKCSKWIVVEGVKDVGSKVPELYWWKHAAACHHDSTLEGEGDYFEQDEAFTKLVSFEQP